MQVHAGIAQRHELEHIISGPERCDIAIRHARLATVVGGVAFRHAVGNTHLARGVAGQLAFLSLPG